MSAASPFPEITMNELRFENSLDDSPLRWFDPRARIVAAAIWSVAVALVQALGALIGAMAIAALLLMLARAHTWRVLARLALVNVFIAALWLFLPWSVPGTAVWSIGPLTITREGLLTATAITLRSNAIVCGCIALLSTLHLPEFAQALLALRVPQKLVAITWACIHFLHVVHDEYLRLLAAVRLRGFVFHTSLHTYRTAGNMAGLLLVRSDDRAERVRDAMLCRGFDGRIRSLTTFHMRSHDVVLMLSLAFLGISLVLLGGI